MLKQNDIVKLRFFNHQISYKKFTSSKDLVNWMGAIQAQDFAMAKLAIGLRIKNSTEEKINSSFNKFEILRTHLLRPTWHIVSSDDIYWLLNLTAPRLKQLLKHRLRNLEITRSILNKSFKFMEKNLEGNKSLNRNKINELFKEAKIKTNENRASHILMNAELNGIICSGLTENNDTTYALLEERVSKKNILTKEESFAKLATKYFQSHSPATIEDFAWWSGLTKKEAQTAVNLIKTDFLIENINRTEFILHRYSEVKKAEKKILFIPAYDEFIISYKDRSAILSYDQHSRVINQNGLFRAVLIMGNKAIGIWKKKSSKDKIEIIINLFEEQPQLLKLKIKKEAEKLSSFWQKDTSVKLN
ncbi:MAG: AlkZ family DNA glycosylase [Ignavibacteriae bacterium]|nr:AlkZ family DNA glycosylase [Ignavibacteriota bacterium]